MTTVKDIAKILASRHKLSNAEADIFMQMIVEVINDGLLRDRIVKIKGFGTFKLQSVKERSSVNVNTGERVVIAEHDKVTFIPDKVMKDVINKPFVQFETVVVSEESLLSGEDVEMDIEADVEEEKQEPELIVQPLTVVEDNEQTQDSPETDEMAIADESDAITEVPVDSVEQDDVTDLEEQGTVTDEEDCDDEDCYKPHVRCRNMFIYYGILINVVVAVIAFALGYCASSLQWFERGETETNVAAASEKRLPKQNAALSRQHEYSNMKETTGADSVKKDTVQQEIERSRQDNKRQNTNVSAGNKADGIADNSQEQPLRQYDTDVRVRTGAYYIVGTDKELQVKKGQTLKSISRASFGEGMECYIEVYNNVKTVKEGDIIKIPKLKLKKKTNK